METGSVMTTTIPPYSCREHDLMREPTRRPAMPHSLSAYTTGQPRRDGPLGAPRRAGVIERGLPELRGVRHADPPDPPRRDLDRRASTRGWPPPGGRDPAGRAEDSGALEAQPLAHRPGPAPNTDATSEVAP